MDIIGFTLRFIKNHNKLVKSLIDGKPVWVISNGKVKTAECMKTVLLLMTSCLSYVLPVFMKSKRLNVRYSNKMGNSRLFQYGDDNLRYPLIVDGQLDDDVLEIIDRDEEWVKAELEKTEHND